jgi:hypothetical protein
MCTGNAIGAEGAKALGEALKLNSTTITELNLKCIKHFFYSFMIFHDVDRFIYSLCVCVCVCVCVYSESYWC